jgi:hypothetical protein
MIKALFRACFVATCFTFALSIAHAQHRLHAVSGTVTSINAKVGMVDIETDDGTSAHFRWVKASDGSINFDKAVRANSTAVDKFRTADDHVIVYYFGEGTIGTAVALHDLGDGSMDESTGRVVNLNGHDRLLTVKDSAGTELSYHLDPKTIADTASGVSQGLKFDLSKGVPFE